MTAEGTLSAPRKRDSRRSLRSVASSSSLVDRAGNAIVEVGKYGESVPIDLVRAADELGQTGLTLASYARSCSRCTSAHPSAAAPLRPTLAARLQPQPTTPARARLPATPRATKAASCQPSRCGRAASRSHQQRPSRPSSASPPRTASASSSLVVQGSLGATSSIASCSAGTMWCVRCLDAIARRGSESRANALVRARSCWTTSFPAQKRPSVIGCELNVVCTRSGGGRRADAELRRTVGTPTLSSSERTWSSLSWLKWIR